MASLCCVHLLHVQDDQKNSCLHIRDIVIRRAVITNKTRAVEFTCLSNPQVHATDSDDLQAHNHAAICQSSFCDAAEISMYKNRADSYYTPFRRSQPVTKLLLNREAGDIRNLTNSLNGVHLHKHPACTYRYSSGTTECHHSSAL